MSLNQDNKPNGPKSLDQLIIIFDATLSFYQNFFFCPDLKFVSNSISWFYFTSELSEVFFLEWI